MTTTETYQLQCHCCFSHVEIPIAGPHVCGKCGTKLQIEWEEGRAEAAGGEVTA